MVFQYKYANTYLIKDSVVEADVDLLGGPEGMLVVLHSIRAVEPLQHEVGSDRDSLVAYLAEKIENEKNWGSTVIIHKGVVLFSTDRELKRGDTISNRVQQISAGDVVKMTFANFLKSLAEIFRKK